MKAFPAAPKTRQRVGNMMVTDRIPVGKVGYFDKR